MYLYLLSNNPNCPLTIHLNHLAEYICDRHDIVGFYEILDDKAFHDAARTLLTHLYDRTFAQKIAGHPSVTIADHSFTIESASGFLTAYNHTELKDPRRRRTYQH